MSVFFHRGTFRITFFILAVCIQLFAQEARQGEKPAESAAAAGQKASGAEPAEQKSVGAEPTQSPVRIHIVPWGKPAPELKPQNKAGGRSSNNGIVQYYGGPVISNVQAVEVLWGNLVASSELNGTPPETIDTFYTDITQSNYFSLLAEYGTVGLNGFGSGNPPGSNQTIGPGTFGGKFTITPSVCPGTAACTITDSQIQNEIINQLNAHNLPAPTQDNQSNFNTIYMIYFPPNVTIELDPRTFSCRRGGFCAYHSNVVSGSLKVPYGVYPDFSQGGCAPFQGCGNGSAFQNLTSASSHELAEAVTDTDVGTATSFAPPLAWADQTTGQEIGDFCNQFEAQVTVNGNTYNVQTQLSNMQGGCVSAPGSFQVQPSTAHAVPGVPFQVTVIPQSSATNAQLAGYNDTVHFTSTDGAASLPADYTFVPATDQGSHTFTLTLNTTGMQTITGTDTLVTHMTGSGQVDIEHNPDLTVTSSHSGSFTQGDTGDTYTLTVFNIGDRATTGTVTITDQLPFGLTATNIAGSGWSCTLGTLTCTRSDVLNPPPPSSSYPPITLTVNVANNAPPSVTNTVTVSGGGEANTSNDTGTDPTTIIQVPDLTVSKSHAGSFAAGQVGANYTITVSNVGFAPTSGTVTLTDTLPSGLTATAMTGSGWSCTLGTLTCTRLDSLANGSAYPAITLTVNVSSSITPGTVTNTATVSGGGEVNAGNDTANDPTQITPAAPDMVISKTHSGNFIQNQTGATYTLTASNIGSLPTTGAVTVTDTLPSGLTATAISGTGWSCVLSTLTCARSDSLPAFTSGTPPSYPAITLTVNVAVNAPPQVTNSATVSGGGEVDTSNDNASDPTTITQLPNLTIGKQHLGNLAQGQTSAQYLITVSNIGPGPTFGTVTVADTLPSGFMATSIGGPGWACTLNNLTCTRSDVLQSGGVYPQITVTVSIALNAATPATNTVTVSGGGEVNTSDDTATDTATLSPPISWTVLSSNTQTVSAGGSAAYAFNINSSTPGTVSFACSNVPQAASCNFSPASAVQGTSLINLTITTTLGGSAAPPARGSGPRPLMPLVWLLSAIAAAEMLRRVMISQSRRRLSVWRPVAGLAGIVALALLFGCGGGPPPPPPRVGTPAGTYAITVTGTNASSNTQASTQITLIVH